VRYTSLFVIGCLCLTTAAFAQDKRTSPPRRDQINLVLTQAERAISQYEASIIVEEATLKKLGEAGIAKDRELLKALNKILALLKQDSQRFNGGLGFLLVLNLDDAVRNSLLCSVTAMSEVGVNVADKQVGEASNYLHAGQTCSDVSTLLYTVSESASDLFSSYLESSQQESLEIAQQLKNCSATLKRN